MARRVALPESKIRRRRRIRRTRLAIVIGVFLLLLVGILIGLSWLPFLRIKTVDIEGSQTLASSTLQTFVEEHIDGRKFFVLPKDNILLYPKNSIAADVLAQFPAVKNVSVRAENFEAIKVDVVERTPAALWCGELRDETATCRLMDENGFVYSTILSGELPPYVRYTGAASTTQGFSAEVEPRTYLDEEAFSALAALVEALGKNQKDTEVISAYVDEHKDVHVAFANGFMLIFALKDAGRDVYERFILALAATPFLNKSTADFEYLDLRFGDKLYYRLR